MVLVIFIFFALPIFLKVNVSLLVLGGVIYFKVFSNRHDQSML